jgi:ketosteroid isomerase-like protein
MASPRELFSAFCDCAIRRDGPAFAALCTDDVVLEFPFANLRFTGRADVCDRATTAWRDSPRRVREFQHVRFTDAGDTLVAEYDVVGEVASRPFRIGGILRLETRGGQIASMREYLDPAALAAARPTTPREVLRRFHAAMQARSADALADLYAPDAIHEFSFAVPHRPPRYVGQAEVRAGYREAWHDHPLDIDAIEDVFVHDASDPEVVVGQWRLRGSLRKTGAPIEATGLLVLRVRDGQIVHCHDFMDGLGLARALGRPPFSPRDS